MFVVEDHVAPGFGERSDGIPPRAEHGIERFRLHQPLGRRAIEGRFAGRRARPVLPIGREIAANHRNLVGISLLELSEQLARGGDHQFRRSVFRIPVFHQIGQRGVDVSVVAPDGPPQLHDVVGIALFLQFGQTCRQVFGQVVVAPQAEHERVAFVGHPTENLLATVGAEPVEGLVFPCRDGPAAVVDIDPERKILHSGLAHRRDDAPGQARHVANHRRVDLHAAAIADRDAPLHQPQQFFRTAQPGQLVAIQGVEFDLSRAHGLDELPLSGGRCLAQIAIDRPEHFHVPLETSPRRIRGRLGAQIQGRVEVLPLLVLHFGLKVRVADVVVGVGQEINDPFSYGLRVAGRQEPRWAMPSKIVPAIPYSKTVRRNRVTRFSFAEGG